MMSRSFQVLRAAVLAALLGAPPAAAAQPGEGGTLRGMVRDAAGAPVEGANVFLLPSLDGTATDSAGAFVLSTTQRGASTLVVQRLGFEEVRLSVTIPSGVSVAVTLSSRSVVLEPIMAQASTFGNDPSRAGVTITPLEAVTTPGSAGDIFRALQTFPGITPINESAGLFVRGGDVSETKILLDGAVVLSPYRLETPTGSSFATFEPFLLSGVFFSSGGYGARYGDALSGLVALETVGRPVRHTLGASASIAALSTTLALALPKGVGVRATATRTNTDLLFRMNGREGFEVPPEGTDLSAGVAWSPTPDRQLKLFALSQRDHVAGAENPGEFLSAFRSDRENHLAVLSGKGVWGAVSPSFALSVSGEDKGESYRAYALDRRERYLQGRGEVGWAPSGDLTLRMGAEWERRTTTLGGHVPGGGDDEAPGAPIRTLQARVAGAREGAWVESEWRLADWLGVTAGLRTDRSDLTRTRTWDPRLAAAARLGGSAALMFAWGRYHQVPAPMAYDDILGRPGGAPPMRAEHLIAALVVGDPGGSGPLFRAEAYQKRYRRLADFGRGLAVGPEGRGTTRGVDLFVHGTGPLGVVGRMSYSFLHGTRTDPNTGVLARSPYDITHAVVLVAEREWNSRWRLGGTYRITTGKPFTDVVGARNAGGRWIPEYGSPYGERLPRFERLDLNASRLYSFWEGNLSAVFFSVNNVLGRRNLSGYRYSDDYSERVPALSPFRRTFFFGVSTTTNW